MGIPDVALIDVDTALQGTVSSRSAWRRALIEAVGPRSYVMVVSRQVTVRQGVAERLLQTLEQAPQVVGVAAPYISAWMRGSGRVDEFVTLDSSFPALGDERHRACRLSEQLDHAWVTPWNTLVRREVFLEVLDQAMPTAPVSWGAALVISGDVRLIGGLPQIEVRTPRPFSLESELDGVDGPTGPVVDRLFFHRQLSLEQRIEKLEQQAAAMTRAEEQVQGAVRDLRQLLLQRTTPEGGLPIPARLRLAVSRRLPTHRRKDD